MREKKNRNTYYYYYFYFDLDVKAIIGLTKRSKTILNHSIDLKVKYNCKPQH